MKYAELIKKIIGNSDVNASLTSLLGNIDAFDKSVPTLDELNMALSALASEGRLKQNSEQEYIIYARQQGVNPFKPISESMYKSICAARWGNMKGILAEQGITENDINKVLEWHSKQCKN